MSRFRLFRNNTLINIPRSKEDTITKKPINLQKMYRTILIMVLHFLIGLSSYIYFEAYQFLIWEIVIAVLYITQIYRIFINKKCYQVFKFFLMTNELLILPFLCNIYIQVCITLICNIQDSDEENFRIIMLGLLRIQLIAIIKGYIVTYVKFSIYIQIYMMFNFDIMIILAQTYVFFNVKNEKMIFQLIFSIIIAGSTIVIIFFLTKISKTRNIKNIETISDYQKLFENSLSQPTFILQKESQEHFTIPFVNKALQVQFDIKENIQYKHLLKFIYVKIEKNTSFQSQKLDYNKPYPLTKVIPELFKYSQITSDFECSFEAAKFILDVQNDEYKKESVYENMHQMMLRNIEKDIYEDYKLYDIKIVNATWKNKRCLLVQLNSKTMKDVNLLQKEIKSFQDHMLSSISHSLITPINILTLLISTFNNQDELGQKMFIRKINCASQVLLQMIYDLIDYSKILKNEIVINKNKFQIQTLINEVIGIFQFDAEGKDIQFQTSYNLQKYQIHTDRQRLKQILMNIIGNSIKYTQKGGVIDITINEEGYCLQFIIKDSGIGMSQTLISKLQILYGTTANRNNKLQHGFGLSLTICKHLSCLIGPQQKLLINSKKHKGTEIKFLVYKNINNKVAEQLKSNKIQQQQKKLIKSQSVNGVNIQYPKLNENHYDRMTNWNMYISKSYRTNDNYNNSFKKMKGIQLSVKEKPGCSISNMYEEEQKISNNRIADETKHNFFKKRKFQQTKSFDKELPRRASTFKTMFSQKSKFTSSSQFISELHLQTPKFDKTATKYDEEDRESNDISPTSSVTSYNRESIPYIQAAGFTSYAQSTDNLRSLKYYSQQSSISNIQQQDICNLTLDQKLSKFLQDNKILLVDDTIFNIIALKQVLNSIVECDISEAINGQDAIDKIAEQQKQNDPFTLVFMDIQMPVMDGLQATAIIREKQEAKEFQDFIIIYNSAFSMDQDSKEYQLADVVLAKPVTIEKLQRVIQQLNQSINQ